MKLIKFGKIDSTHKYLVENYEKHEDKTIIVADEQTGGIGTRGRNWYTGNNDNIAMSIIYKQDFTIKQLEGLTIKIATKVKYAIKDLYNIDLDIKEPNDLMLNNKKICGILTQINTIKGKINYLIISIGFNVNETQFSEEIRDVATSLKKEYEIEFDKDKIIEKFIFELNDIL